MPSISTFYGIIIAMFFDDHVPAHFHAFYQDAEATFNLDGEMLKGDMPKKQQKLIEAWAIIHQEELNKNWELAKNNHEINKIEPLK